MDHRGIPIVATTNKEATTRHPTMFNFYKGAPRSYMLPSFGDETSLLDAYNSFADAYSERQPTVKSDMAFDDFCQQNSKRIPSYMESMKLNNLVSSRLSIDGRNQRLFRQQQMKSLPITRSQQDEFRLTTFPHEHHRLSHAMSPMNVPSTASVTQHSSFPDSQFFDSKITSSYTQQNQSRYNTNYVDANNYTSKNNTAERALNFVYNKSYNGLLSMKPMPSMFDFNPQEIAGSRRSRLPTTGDTKRHARKAKNRASMMYPEQSASQQHVLTVKSNTYSNVVKNKLKKTTPSSKTGTQVNTTYKRNAFEKGPIYAPQQNDENSILFDFYQKNTEELFKPPQAKHWQEIAMEELCKDQMMSNSGNFDKYNFSMNNNLHQQTTKQKPYRDLQNFDNDFGLPNESAQKKNISYSNYIPDYMTNDMYANTKEDIPHENMQNPSLEEMEYLNKLTDFHVSVFLDGKSIDDPFNLVGNESTLVKKRHQSKSRRNSNAERPTTERQKSGRQKNEKPKAEKVRKSEKQKGEKPKKRPKSQSINIENSSVEKQKSDKPKNDSMNIKNHFYENLEKTTPKNEKEILNDNTEHIKQKDDRMNIKKLFYEDLERAIPKNESMDDKGILNDNMEHTKQKNNDLNIERFSCENMKSDTSKSKSLDFDGMWDASIWNDKLLNESILNESVLNESMWDDSIWDDDLWNEKLDIKNLNGENTNSTSINSENMNSEIMNSEIINDENMNNEKIYHENLSDKKMDGEKSMDEVMNREISNSDDLSIGHLNLENLNIENLNCGNLYIENIINENLDIDSMMSESLNIENLSENLNIENLNEILGIEVLSENENNDNIENGDKNIESIEVKNIEKENVDIKSGEVRNIKNEIMNIEKLNIDDQKKTSIDYVSDSSNINGLIIEKPGIKKSEVKNPETNNLEINHPKVNNLKVNHSEVEKLKVEKPKVEKPKIEKPKAHKSKEEKSKAEKPEVEKPEVEKPEVEKPEVEKPEVEKPEVEKPEVEKPKEEKPKEEKPEVETPKVEKSNKKHVKSEKSKKKNDKENAVEESNLIVSKVSRGLVYEKESKMKYDELLITQKESYTTETQYEKTYEKSESTKSDRQELDQINEIWIQSNKNTPGEENKAFVDISTNEDKKSATADSKIDRVQKEIEIIDQEFPELKKFYKLLDRAGRGTFSKVYKAFDLLYEKYMPWSLKKKVDNAFDSNHRCVAIKLIYGISSPKRIANEISCLQDLRGSPCVVPMITALRNEDITYLVLPYIEFDHFEDIYKSMSLLDLKHYISELFTGLKYVHEKGIIHRDIKPGNFLYNKKTKVGYLGDFGLAQKFVNNDIYTELNNKKKPVKSIYTMQKKGNDGYFVNDTRKPIFVDRSGTRSFRAPEIYLHSPRQTTAMDIWAVGVILLSFLTNVYPFFDPEDSAEGIIELIAVFGLKKMRDFATFYGRNIKTNLPEMPEDAVDMDELCRSFNNETIEAWNNNDYLLAVDLMKNCLQLVDSERITAVEALKHPFLQEVMKTSK